MTKTSAHQDTDTNSYREEKLHEKLYTKAGETAKFCLNDVGRGDAGTSMLTAKSSKKHRFCHVYKASRFSSIASKTRF